MARGITGTAADAPAGRRWPSAAFQALFYPLQGKVVVGVGTMVAVAGLRSRGDSGVVETAQSAEGDPMGTDGRKITASKQCFAEKT